MLSVTPGRETEYESLRAALVVSAALSAHLEACEPRAVTPRRPLPSWLGARHRRPIPFPSSRTLMRRPA